MMSSGTRESKALRAAAAGDSGPAPSAAASAAAAAAAALAALSPGRGLRRKAVRAAKATARGGTSARRSEHARQAPPSKAVASAVTAGSLQFQTLAARSSSAAALPVATCWGREGSGYVRVCAV